MKRKYEVLQKYTGKRTKINENTFLNEECVQTESLRVYFCFYADKNGTAFGIIANNYFDYFDDVKLYNELGLNAYKKDLLRRVEKDLEERKQRNKTILEQFVR